jgi:hypothetical protein
VHHDVVAQQTSLNNHDRDHSLSQSRAQADLSGVELESDPEDHFPLASPLTLICRNSWRPRVGVGNEEYNPCLSVGLHVARAAPAYHKARLLYLVRGLP